MHFYAEATLQLTSSLAVSGGTSLWFGSWQRHSHAIDSAQAVSRRSWPHTIVQQVPATSEPEEVSDSEEDHWVITVHEEDAPAASQSPVGADNNAAAAAVAAATAASEGDSSVSSDSNQEEDAGQHADVHTVTTALEHVTVGDDTWLGYAMRQAASPSLFMPMP